MAEQAHGGAEVSLTFSPNAIKVARENAKLNSNKPVGQTVSEALALQHALLEVLASGGRVLVEKNGQLQEVGLLGDISR